MATLGRGISLGSTEQITNTKLQNLVDLGTCTNIVNADIDAAAAIADTKLASITSSNKVSGAALMALASIPSGAGVIPAANLPTAGVASDGSVGIENLVSNGDFEKWSAGASSAPDGFTLSGSGAAVAREATIIKMGTYSAKVTRSGTDCLIYNTDYNVAPILRRGIAYWKSRVVTASCWVYATVASRVCIAIDDGVVESRSSYHTGNSTWQLLTVTATLSSSSTQFSSKCMVVTGDTSGYFDGLMLVEGASAFAFAPRATDIQRVGTFTRDTSTASGSQAVTGVGFKPTTISFFANISSTVSQSYGVDDITTHFCVCYVGNDAAGIMRNDTSYSIVLYNSAGTAAAFGKISSFDADGFTISWNKSGSMTGTATIGYRCS